MTERTHTSRRPGSLSSWYGQEYVFCSVVSYSRPTCWQHQFSARVHLMHKTSAKEHQKRECLASKCPPEYCQGFSILLWLKIIWTSIFIREIKSEKRPSKVSVVSRWNRKPDQTILINHYSKQVKRRRPQLGPEAPRSQPQWVVPPCESHAGGGKELSYRCRGCNCTPLPLTHMHTWPAFHQDI